MFPIRWNKAFRKKDGSISTINEAIQEGGGQYELPTASANTKGGIKIGNGLSMDGEVLNNSNPTQYTLPTASADTLGGVKIGSGLAINDGVLSAGGGSGVKIYYKDFEKLNDAGLVTSQIAILNSNQEAVGSGLYLFYIGSFVGAVDININGYKAVGCQFIDSYTGNKMSGFLDMDSTGYVRFSWGISGRSTMDNNSFDLRVYYVKNEDLVQLN